MTSKIILGALMGVAFLAGTIMTGIAVFADDDDDDDNKKNPIAEAIDRLTAVILDRAVVGPQGEKGDTGDEGPEGPPGGIIGFYKVRVQETVTADEAINGAVREATCDAGDFPISIGWFGNPGNSIDGMSLSEMAGGSASVFVRNLAEGSAYGVGVNCADFSPVHIP